MKQQPGLSFFTEKTLRTLRAIEEGVDLKTLGDSVHQIPDEPCIESYNEEIELFQEGERLNQILSKTSVYFDKILQWFMRAINYVGSIVLNKFSGVRSKYYNQKIDELLKDGKSVSLDAIPLSENAVDDYYSEGKYTDMARKIGNVIIKRRGIIFSFGCSWSLALISPWLKAGFAAYELIHKLIIPYVIPMSKDLMVVMKEIAALKKEYAGKSRKIKFDDGTEKLVVELPAQTYVKIDKYRDIINKWCDKFINQKSKNYTVNIKSTDDILHFGKKFFQVCDEHSNEISKLQNDIANDNNNYFRYLESLANDRSITKRMINVMNPRKMGSVGFLLWTLEMVSVNIFNLINVYDKDGVEYRIKGTPIKHLLSNPAQDYIKSVAMLAKDISNMQTVVEHSIQFADYAIQQKVAVKNVHKKFHKTYTQLQPESVDIIYEDDLNP
jgi:hypothetical protein